MCKIMKSLMPQERNIMQSRIPEKETIHSGHFMVSQFEADAQDDEYQVAVPVPEVSSKKLGIIPLRSISYGNYSIHEKINSPKIMSLSIETSLTKLFQCMSIAYRQKLTSPKWNRFKGVRLRWKEKIRLNNVIWRCWHMQFVMKQNIGVCQFASPLDVDIHSKPEAVVLEGKYWKRKLSAVTAEYKRWRLFHQKLASCPAKEQDVLTQLIGWNSTSESNNSSMMVDEDYTDFISDTLFSTITSNQPFAFPDTREIARNANLADFIQPSLVQLQPNLDDYMDMLEPLQDLLSPPTKLPSVPEEYHPSDDLYRTLNANYEDVSPSNFYQPATNSEIDSVSNKNGNLKLYIKSEQDQSLQLNASENADTKLCYRNNNLYHENVTSTYNNQNSASSYMIYQPHNYQHQSPQSNQHQTEDGIILNYSHQMKSVVPLASTNFNDTSLLSGHNYHSFETNTSYSTNTPSINQSYAPSSSTNYKMLSTGRSSRSTNSSINAVEEELFAVPKLSQKGRSQSGSSLLHNQNRYIHNEQNSPESVTSSALLTQLLTNNRPYGYYSSSNYHQYGNSSGTNLAYYGSNSSCDGRACCVINGRRNVAHCTALLGRRSRTPDHILSTNSNPVGYCKPRIPILSSHGCTEGSLINLSNNQRDGMSDKSYNISDTMNNNTSQVITHSVNYSKHHHHSQSLPKTLFDKYPSSNLTPFHTQTRSSSYHSVNSASPSSSSATPFVFTSGQQNTDTLMSNVSQMASTSTPSSPKHPSSPSTSESLSLSPLTVNSPVCTTPSSPVTKNSGSTSIPYKEHRRVCHINAEQKRRCNIKNGFDTLHMLIPHLVQNPNAKMSKAAMLQKGAEYIRQLRGERSQLKDEIESLKQQVETLNSSISNCQNLLPATGAPVSRHKADKIKEMFDDYVKERTKQNWKFWILSLICEPLLSSFNSTVSTASIEELFRTTIQWTENYCSLVDLRPVVLNALRHLCTSTEILSNPNQLPDEARTVVFSSTRNINKS